MPATTAHARFIGADGSLDYRTGRAYLIEITENRKGDILVECIAGVGHDTIGHPCPYSSPAALARNWYVIHLLVPVSIPAYIVRT